LQAFFGMIWAESGFFACGMGWRQQFYRPMLTVLWQQSGKNMRLFQSGKRWVIVVRLVG
jgi:hypothetical protein